LALQIETASPDDVNVIVSLNASIHELHDRLAPDFFHSAARELVRAEFAKLFTETNTRVLIAWDNGTPVGYCVLKTIELEPNASTRGFRRLYVDQMAVEPDWRRKGVGTATHGSGNSILARTNISEVVLEYWSNNDAARQFYKALNFVPLTEKVILHVEMDI
jgi:diamine N-acetyltransferase